ncbi:MAG: Response regulator consisting of a CheY-like receiver domain and a winged-helix DNA-binding domain [Anaerocolumna sp.]|jgi:DNA-binding response OmpR family regulator|nr:Response regulator consisting of a CheY-like receiver domain and a winged-helix DNA-binding domain [Anaerocolumna sp.]
MRILLIEDDREISEMLKDFLQANDFEVTIAFDGEEGCNAFFLQPFDLILLDLMIPKRNGMEVMKHIRTKSTVPIIIMSAKDTDSDKSLGLGLGADDYITKPFSVTEVLARIKANIRRSTQYAALQKREELTKISMGGLTMNLETFSVTKGEEIIELTAKEFAILKLLLENPKKVYTKAQLYSLVWQENYYGDENAVNVHISRLRTKVEENPREPKYVQTVWGIGYKLGSLKE